MRYDLIDLRLFVAVAEQGNLTRGAQRVHLAPPSASARIRTLEDELGAALLERGARGVTLTPAGQALLRHARSVLGKVEALHAELGAYARGVKGVIRLHANTNATNVFLPQDLASFLAAHPQVNVLLEEQTSPAIAAAVAEGAADLGIVAGDLRAPDLVFLPYREDRLVLVTAPAHRWARRKRISYGEALDEQFVGLAGTSAIHAFMLEHARLAGKTLQMRIQVRSFEAACRMVSAGVGVGLVPHSAAALAANSFPLRIIELAEAWAPRPLQVCFRRNKELTRYEQALVGHLTGVAAA